MISYTTLILSLVFVQVDCRPSDISHSLEYIYHCLLQTSKVELVLKMLGFFSLSIWPPPQKSFVLKITQKSCCSLVLSCHLTVLRYSAV